MAGCSRCGGNAASLQARLQGTPQTSVPTSPNAYGRVTAPSASVRKPLMQRIADKSETKEPGK